MPRLRGEHHRVDLQVGVGLLGAGVDLDQALEARAALAGRGPAPVHVAAGGAGLVQVDREHVQVLVLLGEEEPAEGHVAARARRSASSRCWRTRCPPSSAGQPVAVGVPADADEARGDVVDLAAAPVLHLGQAAARAVLQVHLEGARVQRLARALGVLGEVLGEVVLVHAEVAGRRRRARACARTAPHRGGRSRRRSRRGPRRPRPAGTCRKAPPLQKAALAASSLWRSIGRRLEYQGRDELGVLAEGVLERAEDHAALGQARVELDVHDLAAALHDPPGARALGQRARDDLRARRRARRARPFRGPVEASASRSRLCRLVVQKPERRQTGSSSALVGVAAPPRAAAPSVRPSPAPAPARAW